MDKKLADRIAWQQRENKRLRFELAMIKAELTQVRDELISATAVVRMMLAAERI